MTDSIAALIRHGTKRLTTVSDSPQLDCYLIVSSIIGKPREWLIAHSDEPVSPTDRMDIEALLERRFSGEPVAYIKGTQSFWKREFTVTSDTLIPRPDTELLMEIALTRFDKAPRKVIDLGTGTGALAISLADERPAWQVTGIDISEPALEVARENAGILPNLVFCASSWFSEVPGRFDLIISNPPYIRASDPHLIDLRFEPARALTAGEDGLDCIRHIINNSCDHLEPEGHILLEHGYDQQQTVIALLKSAGFKDIEGFSDLQGQPRAVIARNLT